MYFLKTSLLASSWHFCSALQWFEGFFWRKKVSVWHHLVAPADPSYKACARTSTKVAVGFDDCVFLFVWQDLKPVDVTNKRSLWENKGSSPTKVHKTTTPPSVCSSCTAALRNHLSSSQVKHPSTVSSCSAVPEAFLAFLFSIMCRLTKYFPASWYVWVLTRLCICFVLKNSHS